MSTNKVPPNARDVHGVPIRAGDKVKRVHDFDWGFEKDRNKVYIVHASDTAGIMLVNSPGGYSIADRWNGPNFIVVSGKSRTLPIKRNTNIRK